MKTDGRGLTVVGDDAQAFYGLQQRRGPEQLSGRLRPPARVVLPEQNYLPTLPIDASNRVIAEAGERHAKRLWSDAADGARPTLTIVADEAAQADWVADRCCTVMRPASR